MNKTFLIYVLIYNCITAYFIDDMFAHQSASLGYIYIFPFFWVIAGIIIGILFWKKWIQLKTFWDVLFFVFSTPVPALIFVILTAVVGS